MKKLFTILILSVMFPIYIFCDTFTDAIQDLAMYTACIGTYSMTEAGGGWYDDPHDYYTPQMIASRLAQESGNMTRTITFYGICFDYAQFAYHYVSNYRDYYRSQGMKENQFWMAGVHGDSNKIQLSYPSDSSNYSTVQNGVYVKYPSNSGERIVKSHDGATHHAWFWIQRSDGVWFWIDPTWTDNTGFIWYGYISSNGKEIQCRPSKEYCVNYPNYLNDLPLPPKTGQTEAPSKTANSMNPEETINDAATKWKQQGWYMLGVNIPFSTFSGATNFFEKVGIEYQGGAMVGNSLSNIGLEYLRNYQDENQLNGLVFEILMGYRFLEHIGCYVGGGAGLRFDFSNDKGLPRTDDSILVNTGYFAFKADTGLFINIWKATAKLEFAYDNVLGFSTGIGIGIGHTK